LLGYDPEPGPWTAEHGRSFSALPPGSYRLRVEARDHAGAISAAELIDLEVLSFWWQRPLVQALLGLLGVLLVIATVLLYNRNLRARQRLLKREVAARTTALDAANRRLTELSYQDPLTGVANRRRLMEALDSALPRAIERGLPLGLIVIDVDHFKDYNDRYGHLCGDAALRLVAQTLEHATRAQDLLARYGGEEFAALLLDADHATTVEVAERMRALVAALPAQTRGELLRAITISAGALSTIPEPAASVADLLARADQALYQAKHAGRNRVQAAR
jgi:diguanylate cyclase (GGDEF)-like protein